VARRAGGAEHGELHHSPARGGSIGAAGEIRGFPAAIPEPGTCALGALGLAGVAFVTRRRRT
jgi:hypothetical protein